MPHAPGWAESRRGRPPSATIFIFWLLSVPLKRLDIVCLAEIDGELVASGLVALRCPVQIRSFDGAWRGEVEIGGADSDLGWRRERVFQARPEGTRLLTGV